MFSDITKNTTILSVIADWPSLKKGLILSLLVHISVITVGHALWNTKLTHRVVRMMQSQFSEVRLDDQIYRRTPVIFVDVKATEETVPPKDTQYYGIANTQAANPTTGNDPSHPKFEGQQDKVLKTYDSAHRPVATIASEVEAVKLNPIASGADTSVKEDSLSRLEASKAAEYTEGPTSPIVGSENRSQGSIMIASAKPPPFQEALKSKSQAQDQRPRTIAEVLAKQSQGRVDASPIAGHQYRQEGGVQRFSIHPSFDVQATPLGEYDTKFVAAVQECWYALLRAQRYSLDRIGRVVIEFQLLSDGRIQNLRVVESNVGELYTTLCELAITKPAPYEPWPPQMRKLIGRDYRDVRFTFYY